MSSKTRDIPMFKTTLVILIQVSFSKAQAIFLWKGLFGVAHSSGEMNIYQLLHSKESLQSIQAILTDNHAIFSLVSFDDT